MKNKVPISNFNKKSIVDKSINHLRGILFGIISDGNVNKDEINELNNWVDIHKDMLHINPFNEFMTLIKNTTLNKIPQKEAIEDLYWLCQKYESDFYYYNSVTSDLQILHGICHGILSDGVINDTEIFQLHEWLENNQHLNTYYPYDELRSLILSIISDKKIDEAEKITLKALISQFVNLKTNNIDKKKKNETFNVPIAGLCTSDPNITFKNKTFCITGVLKRGDRVHINNEIKKHGGIPVENVTQNTNYLIVGDNGNPAWAFSCYGRKLEKAIDLRKKGYNITIIHEFDFCDTIDDLSS